jgi:hypothetical protein
VNTSDPVDPDNSLSASFTITNNNFIPLRGVTARIGIGQIFGTGAGDIDRTFVPSYKTSITMPKWENHSLDMDDKFTITPNDLLHVHAGEAQIAIIVVYRPWFLPWKRQKVFRFETKKQSDERLYWYSVPPS